MIASYFIETEWNTTPPEAGVTVARWFFMTGEKKTLIGEAFGPEAYQEALGECNEELRMRSVDFRKWTKVIDSERMTARSRPFEVEPYERRKEEDGQKTLPFDALQRESGDDGEPALR
jgi:hypothetical protein